MPNEPVKNYVLYLKDRAAEINIMAAEYREEPAEHPTKMVFLLDRKEVGVMYLANLLGWSAI